MFPSQKPLNNSDVFSRCGEADQTKAGEWSEPNARAKADAELVNDVRRALWRDAILRAMDYYSIEVRARSGIVYLYGHVVSLTNQHQAEEAIQEVSGIRLIENHLIADDRLVTEVSMALGSLEASHHCKFFTGVSHGVVLLSGIVNDANTKLLAERCAAGNPNVRGVIDSVQVLGSTLEVPDQPFLQPSVGMEIFFLDGISGRVRQVIINPDNRRVVAMTVLGRFADQRQEQESMDASGARPPERLLVLSMTDVRHLTKESGFLKISSKERTREMEFAITDFLVPGKDWNPPFPYCPQDVLFPLEQHGVENPVYLEVPPPVVGVKPEAQLLREQMLANDSPGG